MNHKPCFSLSFISLLLFSLISCNMVGENSVYSELLRPVSVNISGTITALDTGEPISGIEVRILKLDSENNSSYIEQDGIEAVAVTDSEGGFEFDTPIELDVDSYQHYLSLSDPSADPAYYTNDSTVIYALRDSSLEYNDLQMAAYSPQYFTIVSGSVADLITGSAVEELTVTLTNQYDNSSTYEGRTDGEGAFSIADVPVSIYTMELNGEALDTPYIIEDTTITLTNSLSNSLGEFLVAPETATDDLRIVLSWSNRSLNLDTEFSIFNGDFDFNHLGRGNVTLPSALFSINPAFGFAEGTAYWPESMGGEEEWLQGRDQIYPESAVDLADNMNHYAGPPLSPWVVASIDKESIDGSEPEVLTLFKKNPLNQFPANLAYHYEYIKEDVPYNYYPIGMAVYQINCANYSGSIYDSGAQVKVYQGSSYLGKFSVADLDIDTGESNRKFWPVLQIEIGYTTANPASAEDVYFRVVPYGSGATIPASRLPGFFYQETSLPGNASFNYLLDKDEISRFYMVNQIITFNKILFDETGNFYTFDSRCLTADLGWHAYTALGNFRRGFYWSSFPGETDWFNTIEPTTTRLYLVPEDVSARNFQWAQSSWNSESSTDPSLIVSASDLTEWNPGLSVDLPVIHDSTIVNIAGSDFSFLLMATDDGPRGASSVYDYGAGYDELTPVLDSFPSSFWEDGTTGDVLSTGTPRKLRTLATATERDGGVGTFALIGGEGLFTLVTQGIPLVGDATYSGGSWTKKATFLDVNNVINLSSADYQILAIEETPNSGGNHNFVVSVIDNSTNSNLAKLYDVNVGVLGENPTIQERPNQDRIIYDMRYLYIGHDLFLLMATDRGLFFCAEWNKTDIRRYLPNILGDFKITRMFDYNDQLGLLVEGNGMIYGPLPDSYEDLVAVE